MLINISPIELQDSNTGESFTLNEYNKFTYDYKKEDQTVVLTCISLENHVIFESGSTYLFSVKDWNNTIASNFVKLQ